MLSPTNSIFFEFVRAVTPRHDICHSTSTMAFIGTIEYVTRPTFNDFDREDQDNLKSGNSDPLRCYTEFRMRAMNTRDLFHGYLDDKHRHRMRLLLYNATSWALAQGWDKVFAEGVVMVIQNHRRLFGAHVPIFPDEGKCPWRNRHLRAWTDVVRRFVEQWDCW